MYDELVFAAFGCFASIWLIIVGTLMRKFDFSCFFQTGPDDGLYIWSFGKAKKIGDNTPESRMKYSKYMGNFFIGISTLMLCKCVVMLVDLLK